MFKLIPYLSYKLIFWVLLFIPGYYAVESIKTIHFGNKLQTEGIATMGEVVSVETRTTVDDGDVINHYKPTVKYTINEKPFNTKLQEATVSYKQGDIIELLYFPANPTFIKHNHFDVLFFDAIGNLTLTIFLTVIFGAIVYFFSRKFALKFI
jgi:hypothetical protein